MTHKTQYNKGRFDLRVEGKEGANSHMGRRTSSGELAYGVKVKKWRTGLWSEGQQVAN